MRELSYPTVVPPYDHSTLDDSFEKPPVPSPNDNTPVTIKSTAIVEVLCTDEPVQIQPETQYETVWGTLTFAELHEQTNRYAAHVLREDLRYGDNDVDDGLQAGYLKLWQHLQTEPTLLVGRNIGWIGKYLFYAAVHTRQKEQRIAKQQVETETDHSGFVDSLTPASGVIKQHSFESRQADKRIDLHAAIAATANHILTQPAGIEQDRALWALYGITMLQIQVTEMSQMFRVHHRAMKKAYEQVHSLLKGHLEGYAPKQETRPIHNKGRKAQPYQDLCVIRRQNESIAPELYEKVQQVLEEQCPDTLARDLIALQGIRGKVSAKEQACIHNISDSSMERAYERIHLLLAAQRDETIIPRRPQKIRAKAFAFQPEHKPIIQQVANELLNEPNSQGKLVALYSYLCNIPNRASARNFQMSESTLRHYRQHIQERFENLYEIALRPNSRENTEASEVGSSEEASEIPPSKTAPANGNNLSSNEQAFTIHVVDKSATVIYEANKGSRREARKQDIYLRTRHKMTRPPERNSSEHTNSEKAEFLMNTVFDAREVSL